MSQTTSHLESSVCETPIVSKTTTQIMRAVETRAHSLVSTTMQNIWSKPSQHCQVNGSTRLSTQVAMVLPICVPTAPTGATSAVLELDFTQRRPRLTRNSSMLTFGSRHPGNRTGVQKISPKPPMRSRTTRRALASIRCVNRRLDQYQVG